MSTELQLNKLNQLFLVSDSSAEGEGHSEPLIPILQSTLRNNKQQEVLDQLQQLIVKRETEIEKLCHQHHQEFVHSVDQLWIVKQGTNNLKDKIIKLNDQIQEGGTKLLATKTELVQQRRVQQNLETTIETLQTCLHILKLANRVNTLLSNRNYFSALKTLDELQHDHLPQIQQYDFAAYMAECIPSMRDLVKKAVIVEKRDWLEKLKTVSRKEGQAKMNTMMTRQAHWKARTKTSQKSQKDKAVLDELSPVLHLILDEEAEGNFFFVGTSHDSQLYTY
ncbi:Rab GTPase-binding exocyst subunit S15, variant 2 [Entomophthora muscae]|uniref:Rab GTPase-binding exocyst subunit S15, variant 2 n=1 Tax=Entomophthora muscae TaxID=34485 RepID=A0ACC2TK51_9FUNG|nr:Rab GTPase-binding exocyst subunit S15, variant 2 [Entomophthora muscae]